MRKVIFLLLVIFLIIVAILGLRFLLMNLAHFKIKEVSIIDQYGKPLANLQKSLLLNLDDNFNLFSFDMKKLIQDIRAAHPELADVSIRKRFPDKLLIIVKEKEPVAIIVLRDSCLVDAQGVILPFKSAYRNLPKIIGIHPKQIQLYKKSDSLKLKKALLLLKELKKARVCPEYKVSQIDIRQYSNVVFLLEDRIEVKMGQSGFARKASLLSKILAQHKANDALPEYPKYIDMRFDNPVVKP